MRHKINQRGFGAIETILIIIAFAIVGLTSYYVYHTQNNTKATLDQTAKESQHSSSQKDNKTTPPIPRGWQAYDGGSFSFSYPADWIRKDCDHGLVLLGPTANSASLCNTDGTPEVSIAWAIGDSRSNYHLAQADYPDLKQTTVKIAGETATRTSGTLSSSQQVYVGPTNGTKVIQYLFYRKGQTYAFVYTQTPDFGDVSSDFEQLVTKTLSFN